MPHNDKIKPQELRLVKGNTDVVSNVVALIASMAILYYSVKPDEYERHKSIVREWWNGIKFSIDVWEARSAIRSLPETDEPR